MFNIILDPFPMAENQGKHIFPDVIVDISSAHMMQEQLWEPFYLDPSLAGVGHAIGKDWSLQSGGLVFFRSPLFQGAHCVSGLSSHFFSCVFENIHLSSLLGLVLISYLASTGELSFPLFYMDTYMWFYYKYWSFFFFSFSSFLSLALSLLSGHPFFFLSPMLITQYVPPNPCFLYAIYLYINMYAHIYFYYFCVIFNPLFCIFLI